MYLWTKNNWKSAIAPGGASTQKWLKLLQAMISNQACWVTQINTLLEKVIQKTKEN